ncbi:carboxypeptidase-like regulatory domain-containing protein, partial [Myxococcota bacterium]|nr:carboxypeptidase-like regulatory domain-containing protein [Myxococcota bacterium]
MLTPRKKLLLKLLPGAFLLAVLWISFHNSRCGGGDSPQTTSAPVTNAPVGATVDGTAYVDGKPSRNLSLVFTRLSTSGEYSLPFLVTSDQRGELSAHLDPDRTFFVHPISDAFQGIQILRPPHTRLSIQFTSVPSLTGTVIDHKDNPVEAAQVTCEERSTGRVHRTLTDKQGRFLFHLPSLVFCTLVAQTHLFLPSEAQIAAPESKNVLLRLSPKSGITVEVLDESGNPLPKAEVAISGPGIWPPLVDFTNPSGTVHFADLIPGVFSVSASSGRLVGEMEGLDIEGGKKSVVHLTLTEGVFL